MRSIWTRVAALAFLGLLAPGDRAAQAGFELSLEKPWRVYEKKLKTGIARKLFCTKPDCKADIMVDLTLLQNPEGKSCPQCPASVWKDGLLKTLGQGADSIEPVGPYEKSVRDGAQIYTGSFRRTSQKLDQFIATRILVRRRETLQLFAYCDNSEAEMCKKAMKTIVEKLKLTPEGS